MSTAPSPDGHTPPAGPAPRTHLSPHRARSGERARRPLMASQPCSRSRHVIWAPATRADGVTRAAPPLAPRDPRAGAWSCCRGYFTSGPAPSSSFRFLHCAGASELRAARAFCLGGRARRGSCPCPSCTTVPGGPGSNACPGRRDAESPESTPAPSVRLEPEPGICLLSTPWPLHRHAFANTTRRVLGCRRVGPRTQAGKALG